MLINGMRLINWFLAKYLLHVSSYVLLTNTLFGALASPGSGNTGPQSSALGAKTVRELRRPRVGLASLGHGG
eukprot:2524620-Alexandrium_andersonii.AAC.1